jgi:hypothetical protein
VLTAGPKDLIARGKDVVVAAGQTVETAMALDGNVLVRQGAKVKSAVAVNGNVVIEARSKVTGTAAAFGGKIQLAPDAKIEGSRLEIADGFRVTGEREAGRPQAVDLRRVLTTAPGQDGGKARNLPHRAGTGRRHPPLAPR